MQNASTLNSVMVILKNLPELLGTPVAKIGRVGQAMINRSNAKGGTTVKATEERKRPAAKNTPRPFTLEGQILRSGNGHLSVAGEEFEIGNDTWVFGDVEPGAYATVHGVLRNGTRFARKVVVTRPKS